MNLTSGAGGQLVSCPRTGRFQLLATLSGNGRFLRTTAIDHRQTMPAFPAICRSRDLFGVGLRELTRTHSERILGPTRIRQADDKPELMIDRAHGGAYPEQQ
jgi:hypothetical protein